MKNNPIIIPFIELIKRSFSNVLLNIEYFIQLAWLPILILTGLALLEQNIIITLSASSLFATFVSVYWCRKIVLNEDVIWNNLKFKQIWNYICKYILFILIFITPAIIITIIFVSINYTNIKASENVSALYSLPLLATIVISVFCVRLRMALAASAVDDKELGFELAFKLSRQNTARLFFALIIIILPVSIITQMLGLVTTSFETNIVLRIIWNILFYTLTMLSATFYASYDAHVYQYFAYFYHKAIEDGEAQEAGSLAEEKIKARRD